MADQATERFHEFDALRALAMTMGILFHAAWMFMPQYFYFPYPDAAETNWLSYFFCASHTYRMQLFFLVAGFFACMMVQKRGAKEFIANRLRRIAAPFVLFSAALVPLIIFQYNLGGLASGRIQSNQTALALTIEQLTGATVHNLLILHLWFLYYLLLLYAVSLFVRSCASFLPQGSVSFDQILHGFESLVKSGWMLPLLIVCSTALMLPSRHWFGIDSPVVGVVPQWKTVAEYWLFFGFGWALYHRRNLLDVLQVGYSWKLALGALLTIPLFFAWIYFNDNGYTTWGYPLLGRYQIADFAKLADGITSNASPDQALAGALLPSEMKEFLAANRTFTEHQKAGIADSLNSSIILSGGYFAAEARVELGEKGAAILQKPNGTRTPAEIMLANRLALEALFPGIIRGEERRQPHYWLYRLAYTITYSSAMWLVVIGLLGMFRRWCSIPRPLFRYWADGSYWMYLTHINLLFLIQYSLGDRDWHWTIKFPLYLVFCLAILLPSYHYLVRNTWLGLLLNGKRAR